ncbi:hypothetical protein H3N56_12485 [Cetobacterium sp. 2A]|uniref:plasmid mobilization protein n=1 Tax=Cetobacterium sp. 2A TaxID=2754723 RepID=UPI00163C0732|nr:ribbon-helix-helix protein, CopG family [Cetobacterium sp. 2A]MBC2857240.1 hypothetical protein [Cetobacterium sp. 2A]MBC2857247.1 hypothetical protein [Cetobacterium sp. 2A]MBC2857250.1 hypothetical protein [Cetobacterium sp. 2A]
MKNLSVRLNEEDYNILEIKSNALGVTKNEFIRRIIRLSVIDNIEDFNTNLKELLLLKRSLSNNINQLAKKGHNVEKFEEVKKELDELWESLNQ